MVPTRGWAESVQNTRLPIHSSERTAGKPVASTISARNAHVGRLLDALHLVKDMRIPGRNLHPLTTFVPARVETTSLVQGMQTPAAPYHVPPAETNPHALRATLEGIASSAVIARERGFEYLARWERTVGIGLVHAVAMSGFVILDTPLVFAVSRVTWSRCHALDP